jgi:NAD(P)-dependent dehydrogenase (short-subunit alcohol dehydrogenase family)
MTGETALPLSGKAALITGASLPNGIGLATAKRYAAAGCALYLAAEGPPEHLAANALACAALAPAGAAVAHGLHDLTLPGEAERMVAAAAERLGRVDILVNNAALRISRPFGDYSRADFDAVVAVNLAAPFFASQAVLPLMRRQGGGRIIHIASQLARVALPERALYGLTKAALVHLTRCMAFELGREGIMVNAISPGPVATQRALERIRESPELQKQLEGDIPLGRSGRPEEIAEVAYFLATSAPDFLQGEDLCVDGGYTIH